MPTLIGMWNVNERFESAVILEKLAEVGFQVGSTGGVVRVEKYGCASEFRRTQDNHYQSLLNTEIANGQRRLNDLAVAIGHFKFLKTALITRFPDFKLWTQPFPHEG